MKIDWDKIGENLEEISIKEISEVEIKKDWKPISKRLRWNNFLSFNLSRLNIWYLGATVIITVSTSLILLNKKTNSDRPIKKAINKEKSIELTENNQLKNNQNYSLSVTPKLEQERIEIPNNNSVKNNDIQMQINHKNIDTISSITFPNNIIPSIQSDSLKNKQVVVKRRKQVVKKVVTTVDTVHVYQ
jgi:hypothetical protein